MKKVLGIMIVLLTATAVISNVHSKQLRQIAALELQAEMLQDDIAELEKILAAPDKLGFASWYGESDEDCLGCRADRLMANGEKFDENALTMATGYRYVYDTETGNYSVTPDIPLGSIVTIKNPETGINIEVEVTDTGGFYVLDRVADLSKGAKNALGCGDMCYVEIYYGVK